MYGLNFFFGLLNNLFLREINLYLNLEWIVGYRYYFMFGLILDIIIIFSLELFDIIVLFLFLIKRN